MVNLQGDYKVRSRVMYINVCVLTVLFTSLYAQESGSPCVTPNGEKAKCIPIDSCDVIKRSITYLDSDAIEFARQSHCGSEKNTHFVCCGTVAKHILTTTQGTAPHKTSEEVFISNPQSFPNSVDNYLLPDKTLCGLQSAENKKEGAYVTEITEFPWLVALKYENEENYRRSFRCSGSLINDRYVLTTAACLDLNGFQLVGVRLGEWNFTSKMDCVETPDKICATYQDFDIEEVTPHRYFNRKNLDNNIALIRLNKPVVYSDHIRAICLPPSDNPAPTSSTIMDVSSWELQNYGELGGLKVKMRVPMISAEDCMKIYSNYMINMNNGCIGKSRKHKTSCHINLGGPLMRKYYKTDSTDEEQFYLEGLVSKSPSDAHYQPGIYVRVSKYTNWIIQNLRQ